MFGNLKRKDHSWSVIFSLLLLSSCSNDHATQSKTIVGETQGTTYTVILVDSGVDVKKKSIDSLLHQFDLSLSTYIDSSLISRMNNTDDSITILDTFGYVRNCYGLSQKIYKLTKGAFDPSVFPLVKGYGFMTGMETPLSDEKIDSILKFVSFENGLNHTFNVSGDSVTFVKKNNGFRMDFNAIAQGYSVDILAMYLENKGIKNYYVEIGGEIRVKGHNAEGNLWRIGIDVPEESNDSREIENIVHVSDRSVATSGNYRKFYVKDGIKYSHTIDPFTGKPVEHSLLSATVIADDCATADAFATAFMVMGTQPTLRFIEENNHLNLHVYLLEADPNGTVKRYMSVGFKQFLDE